MILTAVNVYTDEIPAFFVTESFQRAHIGIHVVDLKTKMEMISYNKGQYFNPASVQKLITTAAALSSLGPEYRFTTSLEYEGNIDTQGTLHGNLWICGGGDPTLEWDIFSVWESSLKEAGIHQIEGKVCADVSNFETALASPHWEFCDLGNYYGVGASGLTINQGMYHLTFKPGDKVGDPATVIAVEPHIPFLYYVNEVKTGAEGSGDQVVVYGSEYSSKQYYRGTVPLNEPSFTVKAAIPDPSLFCTMEFAKKVGSLKGHEVFHIKPSKQAKRVELYRHESIPLKELIHTMNGESNNLFAEHLVKAIGKGSTTGGIDWIMEFLKWQKIPAKIYDGAGIARKNMITPEGMTTLLCNMHASAHRDIFYHSLPSFPKEDPLPNLRVKTGSMTGVYNIAGFMTLSSGKEVAFAIFCNQYEGSLQEIRAEFTRFLRILAHTDDQKE